MARRILALLLLLLATTFIPQGWAAQIDDQWSAYAEMRLRYELMNGFNDKEYGENPKLGDSHDGYLLSRIRLGTTYAFTPNLLVKVSIQDSRAIEWDFNENDWYNKEFGMIHNPQEDKFELYHTYLEAKNLAGLPLTLITGRQKIAYGDMRVFGPGEWKNSGKWIWDAAKLSYAKNGHFLDFFYGATMLHEPDDFSLSHRWGYIGAGIYGHYAWEKGAVEPMLVYKHNRDGESKYDSLTHYYAGLRVYDDDIGSFFYNGTYIMQWGEYTALSGTQSDVDAYGWHLDAGYTFKTGKSKIKIGGGYTYATGEDKDTDDIEKFDAVFGASDKYYGRMNLMTWSNLKDAEAFIIAFPLEKLKIKAEYHRFRMADKSDKWRSYKNGTGIDEDHLGDEVDILASYGLSENIALQAGYSHFWPGSFIEENVPADNESDWFFFQATFSI